jgi:hypothetical protein
MRGEECKPATGRPDNFFITAEKIPTRQQVVAF